MAALEAKAFQISIDKDELEFLRKKLELARLPTSLTQSRWGEDNGVSISFLRDIVDHWLHHYDWSDEQEKLNKLPLFLTKISLNGFGTFDIQFVHAKKKQQNDGQKDEAIPLLFLHGWPGNFTEVTKILAPLQDAGFDVVAPSLPGYGFSSYTDEPGFKHWHTGDIMHQLMRGLGYDKYVVAGGDWGAMITRSMALLYPDEIRAIHLTTVFVLPPEDKDTLPYDAFEQNSLAVMQWFNASQNAYGQVQTTKPRTLGFAMHDSPVGMLAWMADKLLLWTDKYAWTKDELITWTLLHYLPGPTTGFQMYHENIPVFIADELPPGVAEATGDKEKGYVTVPTGVSAFAREVYMVPRSWAERRFNIVSWIQHSRGGHFAAYERPEEFCADLIPFFNHQWGRT